MKEPKDDLNMYSPFSSRHRRGARCLFFLEPSASNGCSQPQNPLGIGSFFTIFANHWGRAAVSLTVQVEGLAADFQGCPCEDSSLPPPPTTFSPPVTAAGNLHRDWRLPSPALALRGIASRWNDPQADCGHRS